MSKKTTDSTLKKCDDLIERLGQLKKALGGITTQASPRKPVNALGIGWSQDPSTGAFHHSTHGIISTMKNPEGGFDIKHGGRAVGSVGDMSQAGLKIKNYVNSLQTGDTGSHNLDPMAVGKADVEKSGYGPKGGGQYTPADNVRRKANNTGDKFGSQNSKSYTHRATATPKPPSGPAGPVKQYTPAQIAAINEARKLKKNAETNSWVQHASVPNADQEVAKIQAANPAVPAEDLMANQLANLMQGRSMLGQEHRQPSSEDMIMAGERMGLGTSPELIKSQDKQWNGAINNWLAEASKPISARFESQEQEEAYWASIKVSDRDDSGSGY
jgi:hypothetical protein